jgi:hypothetical protein
MGDGTSSEGEVITKGSAVDASERFTLKVKRCRICLSTIPAPRFRYCSAYCARKGKVALQEWRRRHGSGQPG